MLVSGLGKLSILSLTFPEDRYTFLCPNLMGTPRSRSTVGVDPFLKGTC